MYQTSKTVAKSTIIFSSIVFTTCFVHWILVNLYTHYCAPLSIYGVFYTLLSLGSPLCQFINTFQLEVAKHYITIWTIAGASLLTWFATTINFKNNK